MTTHTDLLNFIADKIGAKSYLEIGTFNPDHNFNKIKIAKKVSIDPDPAARAIFRGASDEYFKLFEDKYDLILVDGLHYAEQARKDIINSWECLNPGGVIVIHDCNPPTEITTCIPRGTQREWCGDVWKTAVNIQGGDNFTVDFDYGCMVIRRVGDAIIIDDQEYDWKYFDKNRRPLLNLLTIDQSIQRISAW